jgi:hypothetical protein
MSGFGEYIGNLLAALVSLRGFTLAMEHVDIDRNWKWVRGEWVFCDEAEYPSSFTSRKYCIVHIVSTLQTLRRLAHLRTRVTSSTPRRRVDLEPLPSRRTCMLISTLVHIICTYKIPRI